MSSSAGAVKTTGLVDTASLSATLLNINKALWSGVKLTGTQRQAAVNWILSRHEQPRAYQGLFAPMPEDFNGGAELFSGEKLNSGAQVAHILGEEAMRALLLLDPRSSAVRRTAGRVTDRLMQWIWQSPSMPEKFCCSTCTVAMWRNMLAGGLEDQERIIRAGLKRLNRMRDGKGRWKSYPFYYTILALIEMPYRAAKSELKYAAVSCERTARRNIGASDTGRRRHQIVLRALEVYS